MCLIVFAWQAHPEYRLVLGANRDEFHARPAAPLGWWADEPAILGGRDLAAGGTWLALARAGRFATVTNYREDLAPHPGVRSRGEIVTRFLKGGERALPFADTLEGERYAGFSLLAGEFGDADRLVYVSNRGDPARALAPGLYGLSNASLDTPWPKLLRSKGRLQTLLDDRRIDADALFALLADREPGSSEDIANAIADDLPPQTARAIAAPFVVTPEYGTRCSTVVLVGATGVVDIHERRFDAAGARTGDSHTRFVIAG
ncbi:MAG TPA: NRDE family protein [Woeseiaceae bacterium]|nr:NRDE family protein [Woeseiaceae bacterium]